MAWRTSLVQCWKILACLTTMLVTVNAWGEWKACETPTPDLAAGENDGSKEYLDKVAKFQEKYCAKNDVGWDCVDNGTNIFTFLDPASEPPPPAYCMNCNGPGFDCKILYKVVLENSEESDPFEVTYAVYAKLEEDNGEDIYEARRVNKGCKQQAQAHQD